MTGNNSNSSDVGIIVLISFAILALIPLAIGFDNFEELLRVGKIILIVILIITVITGAVFGYIFYKRKVGKRNAKNKGNTDESIDSEKHEESLKVKPKERGPKEIEIVNPIFDETDEVRPLEKRKQMS